MTNLRRQMAALKMGPAETVKLYFNRWTTLAWKLQAMGALVDDQQVVTALLAGLPAKCELASAVLCGQPGVAVALAKEQLVAAETRLGLERRAVVSGSALSEGPRLPTAPPRMSQHPLPKPWRRMSSWRWALLKATTTQWTAPRGT